MAFLLTILKPLEWFNDWAGRIGRNLSVAAIAIMVIVILLQVFFRYVLNNALPWPDEAARFMMLWLTGLMAPVALRQGGMVAITGVLELFPAPAVRIVSTLLLCLSLLVLVIAAQLGWKHVNSGWLFSSSSLRLPLSIIGMKSQKLKLAWSTRVEEIDDAFRRRWKVRLFGCQGVRAILRKYFFSEGGSAME